MTIFNDRRLPNSAALTDDPADLSTSAYPTVTTADLVHGLVERSGNPRQAMGARYGTDYLCHTCLGRPDQPTAEGHPYVPMIGRTPGVSQDVDWGRTRNSQPGEAPGQAQMDISDLAIDSGLAETRWNQASSRQRQGQWPR
jgi:hypothetical protein